ncbi:hypothetical protein JKP88DRAFT_279159 [Tribonema minus]|uniref:HNH nuclease domain-containing protein n=1 Tax=Tribonema minus TaxID=303371 RepID=A0A835YWY9_9STRA|nr:hypothetical protein JKP88DRAFT_279159 [Tribonema minus]
MPDLTPDEISELASFLSPRDRAALFSTTSGARAAYAADFPELVEDVNAVAAESRRELAQCRAELQRCREELARVREEALTEEVQHGAYLDVLGDRLFDVLGSMEEARRPRPRDPKAECDEWQRLVREHRLSSVRVPSAAAPAAPLEPRGTARAPRHRSSPAAPLEPRGTARAPRHRSSLAAPLEPRGAARAPRHRSSPGGREGGRRGRAVASPPPRPLALRNCVHPPLESVPGLPATPPPTSPSVRRAMLCMRVKHHRLDPHAPKPPPPLRKRIAAKLARDCQALKRCYRSSSRREFIAATTRGDLRNDEVTRLRKAAADWAKRARSRAATAATARATAAVAAAIEAARVTPPAAPREEDAPAGADPPAGAAAGDGAGCLLRLTEAHRRWRTTSDAARVMYGLEVQVQSPREEDEAWGPEAPRRTAAARPRFFGSGFVSESDAPAAAAALAAAARPAAGSGSGAAAGDEDDHWRLLLPGDGDSGGDGDSTDYSSCCGSWSDADETEEPPEAPAGRDGTVQEGGGGGEEVRLYDVDLRDASAGSRGARERADWLCPLCVSPLGNAVDVDHVVPLWRGGADLPSNLQVLCLSCHRRKTSLEAAARCAARASEGGAALVCDVCLAVESTSASARASAPRLVTTTFLPLTALDAEAGCATDVAAAAAAAAAAADDSALVAASAQADAEAAAAAADPAAAAAAESAPSPALSSSVPLTAMATRISSNPFSRAPTVSLRPSRPCRAASMASSRADREEDADSAAAAAISCMAGPNADTLSSTRSVTADDVRTSAFSSLSSRSALREAMSAVSPPEEEVEDAEGKAQGRATPEGRAAAGPALLEDALRETRPTPDVRRDDVARSPTAASGASSSPKHVAKFNSLLLLFLTDLADTLPGFPCVSSARDWLAALSAVDPANDGVVRAFADAARSVGAVLTPGDPACCSIAQSVAGSTGLVSREEIAEVLAALSEEDKEACFRYAGRLAACARKAVPAPPGGGGKPDLGAALAALPLAAPGGEGAPPGGMLRAAFAAAADRLASALEAPGLPREAERAVAAGALRSPDVSSGGSVLHSVAAALLEDMGEGGAQDAVMGAEEYLRTRGFPLMPGGPDAAAEVLDAMGPDAAAALASALVQAVALALTPSTLSPEALEGLERVARGFSEKVNSGELDIAAMGSDPMALLDVLMNSGMGADLMSLMV